METRRISHHIVDFSRRKHGSLRMGKKRLMELIPKLKNKNVWVIFISTDGTRARVLHTGLGCLLQNLVLLVNPRSKRELIKSQWHNYVANVLGIKP